jgi:hypothetical protein
MGIAIFRRKLWLARPASHAVYCHQLASKEGGGRSQVYKPKDEDLLQVNRIHNDCTENLRVVLAARSASAGPAGDSRSGQSRRTWQTEEGKKKERKKSVKLTSRIGTKWVY